MRYERISADCHIDLCWLPPDLFTANATEALRERMPYVTDGPKGPLWVTTRGATLGLVNGIDRKSTRLNSSHVSISYAVLCLKKKNTEPEEVLYGTCR